MSHNERTASRMRRVRHASGRVVLVALAVVTGAGVVAGVYGAQREAARRQAAALSELRDEVRSLAVRVERLEQSASVRQAAEQQTVFFTRTDARGEIEVVGVDRPTPPAGGDPQQAVRYAIEALLEGPPAGDVDGRPLYTQIPEGTRLLGVRIEGDRAYLNFSREFEQTAGTMRIAGILRQVVYTATAIPPVRTVVLMVEGEQVGTEEHPFTGDGLLFGELSRQRVPL